MALTLPMEALSNMQVSFKVRLPDGTFEFDMASIMDPSKTNNLQSEAGMKLHLRASSDPSGVTLILFTSGIRNGRMGEGPETGLGFGSGSLAGTTVQPHSTDAPETDQSASTHSDADFLYPTEVMSEPLDDLSFGAFGPNSTLSDLPDVSTGFSYFLFNNLNLEYNCHSNTAGNLLDGNHVEPMNTKSLLDGGSTNVIPYSSPGPIPCSPFRDDTPATSPRSSSDSTYPPPRARPARADLICPEPSCARRFTSRHTLSKHARIHEPKIQKVFPCTMGCILQFSRKHDRLRHEVTQHGRICEWGCNVCLGPFSSESTLKNHKCKNFQGARRTENR
ncbi:hypothetical protein DFH07DRAFT_335591 [Mycena maculata]|uniref:C2H2-type domain-containing protein n=1 Tax=Mycena maculata TaxID=230809 RepID=A0AAD7NM53_9AGAR|nr:hypothetical protein DFH07DRAFT_335591 [Mycena maculata]